MLALNNNFYSVPLFFVGKTLQHSSVFLVVNVQNKMQTLFTISMFHQNDVSHD